MAPLSPNRSTTDRTRSDLPLESFAPAITPRPRSTTQLPTTSPESLALSRALKKRGFSFVGPTTMFALFEATGIVDTHLVGCHRRGISGRWPS
jgi:DNA-3-methyladenine glycosylase I